ncbi:hypothetical protein Droror1_Dr00026686 [Drosera rotundifolia]
MHDASRGGEIFVVIKLENSGGDLVNREEGFEGECYQLVFNFGRSVRICSGSNDSVQISLAVLLFLSPQHQSKQLGLGFPRSTEFMHDASRGGEIFVVIKLENSGGDLVNREEGFEGECYQLVFNFGRSVRICSGSNDSVQISLGKVDCS